MADGLQQVVIGDPEERALRAIVTMALDDAVARTGLAEREARHLRAVLAERNQVPAEVFLAGARSVAGLQAGLRAWTSGLNEPEFGCAGYLSGSGVSPAELADWLADRIQDGIQANARSGGVLKNLADWLWRDAVTDSLARVESANRMRTGRLAEFLDYAERLGPSEASGLRGRDSELDEIRAFCHGEGQQYRWVQGELWAGKTALASWVFRHPPENTTAVAFFVRQLSRTYRNAEQYALAMAEQLAALANQPVPPREAAERHLSGLLSDAAAEVATYDPPHRMLLIVDGLDEDCTTSGETIADLLPQEPPANVRILVTSRPLLRRPREGHPLAQCVPVQLRKSDFAKNLQVDAEDQLADAVRSDGPSRQVAGLLTAAGGGGLTAAELAELTGLDSGEVRDAIYGKLGRNLRQASDGVLEFAHANLLQVARAYFKDDLPKYSGRLLRWAESYQARGWPKETPSFLLSAFYPALLLADTENQYGTQAERIIGFVADRARHDRMLDRLGADGPALAELADVWKSVAEGQEPCFATLALIAFERSRLSSRNRNVSPELPAVWARLGEADRAVELALSLPLLRLRSEALIAVAEVVAPSDPRRAELAALHTSYSDWQAQGLAKAAAAAPAYRERFLDPARKLARKIERPERQADAIAAIAAAMTPFDAAAARSFAAEFTGAAWLKLRPLTAIVEAAVKAGHRETAASVAADCRREAAAIKGIDRDLALGRVIRALWPAHPDLAEQLLEDLDDPAWTLTYLAILAAKTSPQAAAGFAQRALAAERVGSGSERRTVAARAMAVIDPAGAVAFAQQVDDPRHRAETIEVIVEAVVQVDPSRHAWAADLAKTITDEHVRARALKACAVEAVRSDPDLAVRAASDIGPHEEHADALARVAAAISEDDPDRAASLAKESEAVARSASDYDKSVRQLAALAQATAPVDAGLAETCARTITARPDWRAAALTAVIEAITSAADGGGRHAEDLIREVDGVVSDPRRRDMLAMITALVAAVRPLGDPWLGCLAYRATLVMAEIEDDSAWVRAQASLARALGSAAGEAAIGRLWRVYEPICMEGPRDSRDERWWKTAADVAWATAPFNQHLALVIMKPIAADAATFTVTAPETQPSQPQPDPRDSEDMTEVINWATASQSPGSLVEPSGGLWIVDALARVAAALPSASRAAALALTDAAASAARSIPKPDPRGEALASIAVSLVKLDPRYARTLALEAVAALRHAHSYFSGKATVQIAKVAKASPDPELGKAARHALTGALNSDSWLDALPALAALEPKAIKTVCATITNQDCNWIGPSSARYDYS